MHEFLQPRGWVHDELDRRLSAGAEQRPVASVAKITVPPPIPVTTVAPTAKRDDLAELLKARALATGKHKPVISEQTQQLLDARRLAGGH